MNLLDLVKSFVASLNISTGTQNLTPGLQIFRGTIEEQIALATSNRIASQVYPSSKPVSFNPLVDLSETDQGIRAQNFQWARSHNIPNLQAWQDFQDAQFWNWKN